MRDHPDKQRLIPSIGETVIHGSEGRPSVALLSPARMAMSRGVASSGAFRFRKRIDRHLIA